MRSTGPARQGNRHARAGAESPDGQVRAGTGRAGGECARLPQRISHRGRRAEADGGRRDQQEMRDPLASDQRAVDVVTGKLIAVGKIRRGFSLRAGSTGARAGKLSADALSAAMTRLWSLQLWQKPRSRRKFGVTDRVA